MLLARPPFENQRGIGAAKAKRIRKGIFDRSLARVIRNVVQIALGIGRLQVDGRRQNLVAERQNADACLNPPAPPSRCPVMDLVELMGTSLARSPNNLFSARVSMTSPSGVEVPCAFT